MHWCRRRICVVAFQVYDVNNDGKIDYDDLYQIVQCMVGNNIPQQEIQNIVQESIQEADVLDGDGAISFLEFKRAMFNADLENILTIEFWIIFELYIQIRLLVVLVSYDYW